MNRSNLDSQTFFEFGPFFHHVDFKFLFLPEQFVAPVARAAGTRKFVNIIDDTNNILPLTQLHLYLLQALCFILDVLYNIFL